VLVEISVIEQRYQAVLAVVQDGWRVVEVARRVESPRSSASPSPAGGRWLRRLFLPDQARLRHRNHGPNGLWRRKRGTQLLRRLGRRLLPGTRTSPKRCMEALACQQP
jgi:hypothetical protein